ncbi:MAG: tetratricopeptide repeat protein [Myxococcota bacterium]
MKAFAAAHTEHISVAQRAQSIEAEFYYAMGQRSRALASLESLAAHDRISDEEGARALDRLSEFYAAMGDYDAVERTTVRLMRRFGGARLVIQRAARRLVDMAIEDGRTAPQAVLESMVRRYDDLPMLTAQAAMKRAELLDGQGLDELALREWRSIVSSYPEQRSVLARGLEHIAQAAARQGRREEALDNYERLLAEFPEDAAIRSLANRGMVQLALVDARQLERQARQEKRADRRTSALRTAQASYERVLRSNGELLAAHRRYIALGAELGELAPILRRYQSIARERPRHAVARYAYGYALSYAGSRQLKAAMREMQQALSLDPRLAAAHLTLGWLRMRREQQEPAQGWLEEAIDSFQSVESLLAPVVAQDPHGFEAELAAAAALNAGNAFFALGKTDSAFSAYLKRALSDVPFDHSATENLFYESFARSALAQGEYAVAIDMARLAQRGTVQRKTALTALLGAIHLTARDNEGAIEWYSKAIDLYDKRSDMARLVPMLRGRALALRAQERYDEALRDFRRALQIVAQGKGPGEAVPPGADRMFATEVIADPFNITRAKYGFSGRQEASIAKALSSELLSSLGDLPGALNYSDEQLRLLREESKRYEDGRLRPELLAALHESAVLYVRTGDPSRGLALWLEAMDMGRVLAADACAQKNPIMWETWTSLLVMLDSLSHLWQAQPDLRASSFAQANLTAHESLRLIEGQDSGMKQTQRQRLIRRFSRWLAIEGLRDTVHLSDEGGEQAANVVGYLRLLDQSVARSAQALAFAQAAQDERLVSHIAAYRGEAIADLVAPENAEVLPELAPAGPGAAAVVSLPVAATVSADPLSTHSPKSWRQAFDQAY